MRAFQREARHYCAVAAAHTVCAARVSDRAHVRTWNPTESENNHRRPRLTCTRDSLTFPHRWWKRGPGHNFCGIKSPGTLLASRACRAVSARERSWLATFFAPSSPRWLREDNGNCPLGREKERGRENGKERQKETPVYLLRADVICVSQLKSHESRRESQGLLVSQQLRDGSEIASRRAYRLYDLCPLIGFIYVERGVIIGEENVAPA